MTRHSSIWWALNSHSVRTVKGSHNATKTLMTCRTCAMMPRQGSMYATGLDMDIWQDIIFPCPGIGRSYAMLHAWRSTAHEKVLSWLHPQDVLGPIYLLKCHNPRTFIVWCAYSLPGDQPHRVTSAPCQATSTLPWNLRGTWITKDISAIPFTLTTMNPITAFVIFSIAILLLQWLKKLSRPGLPLPPGPKGYPIIGNMLDIPKDLPWKTFKEWTKVYGLCLLYACSSADQFLTAFRWRALLEPTWRFYHCTRVNSSGLRPPRKAIRFIFRQTCIHIAQNVSSLDRHGHFFPAYVSLDVMGLELQFHVLLTRVENPSTRVPPTFNSRAVPKYQPIQLRECRRFLQRILQSPSSDLAQSIRQYVTLSSPYDCVSQTKPVYSQRPSSKSPTTWMCPTWMTSMSAWRKKGLKPSVFPLFPVSIGWNTFHLWDTFQAGYQGPLPRRWLNTINLSLWQCETNRLMISRKIWWAEVLIRQYRAVY